MIRFGSLLLMTVLLAISPVARAASPWYVDEGASGKPYTWPDGKIVWYGEKSGLGPLSEKEVLKIVQQAFDVWAKASLKTTDPVGIGLTSIRTTGVQAIPGGVITEKTNSESDKEAMIEKYLRLGKPVIIMDTDGALTQALAAIADPSDIAAMTFVKVEGDGPFWSTLNPTNVTIRAGVSILNAKFLDGVKKYDPNNPRVKMFLATVIHEFGHLFNLDHSALNADLCHYDTALLQLKCDQTNTQAYPTMFPIILTPSQSDLHWDDIVAISNLYPTIDLESQFCSIAGAIVGADDLGFQGALVMARSTKDARTVAVSAVTGSQFPANTADGSYILRGIPPNVPFAVSYGEIPESFVGPSAVGPFGVDEGTTPRNVESGTISAGNGKAAIVQCKKGGETLVMDTIKLSVSGGGIAPKSQIIVVPTPAATSGSGAAAKASCSLILDLRD